MAQRPLFFLSPLFLVAVAAGWWLQEPQSADVLLLERAFHLGDTETPEWPEASATPMVKGAFALSFSLSEEQHQRLTAATPAALRLTVRNVNNHWDLLLNGTVFGSLPLVEDREECLIPVPSALLLVGANHFAVQTKHLADDITLGPISLAGESYREILDLAPLPLLVTDEAGRAMPARLTIVNGEGEMVPLYDPEGSGLSLRPGVAYTDQHGELYCEVAKNQNLTIYATRGPEWSVAEVQFSSNQILGVTTLQLHKEIDTDGWLSVDTHLHTLTFSGHGDASVEERVRTLTGEGLDVAIATDHNHQTDYSSWQNEAGFHDHYRSIIGNEVTTDIGHFNAFPFAPNAAKPNAKIIDWQELFDEIMAKGAKAIILNHPRWPSRTKGPYGVSNLNTATGHFRDGLVLPVHAMEVLNATTPEVPWQELRQDWFSLLNAGSRLRGVGSSDSHTVFDPVGQGRTWIAASSDNPLEVSEEEIAMAVREGRSSMGLGLFGTLQVSGAMPGDLLAPADDQLQVELRIPLQSWAQVSLIEVALNGETVASMEVGEEQGSGGREQRFSFLLPAPTHDAWLVVSASGPRPQAPWWTCQFPDLVWISNPVWIDADHDGVYRSPMEIATALLESAPRDEQELPKPSGLAKLLKEVDLAVAVQVLVAAQKQWGELAPKRVAMIPGLSPPAFRAPLEALLSESP